MWFCYCLPSEGNQQLIFSTHFQLQEAFAKGLIKPGVNILVDKDKPLKDVAINNVPGLKAALERLVEKVEWIDRMDVVTDLAPLSAEMAVQIEREEQKRANYFKGNARIPKVAPEIDPVLNDFKREIHFQRQAQAAAKEAFRRLRELNIPTQRPDDYFAEMVKPDEHMQKIRKMLMAKEEGQKKSERVRQIREQKKMAKAVQREAQAKKAADKKKMLDDVKAFRKGKLKNLDFLDDNKGKKSGGSAKKNKKGKTSSMKNSKREFKDAKYGFGGRKRNSKRNNEETFSKGKKLKGKPVRPGKTKRAQMKNRSKNSRR